MVLKVRGMHVSTHSPAYEQWREGLLQSQGRSLGTSPHVELSKEQKRMGRGGQWRRGGTTCFNGTEVKKNSKWRQWKFWQMRNRGCLGRGLRSDVWIPQHHLQWSWWQSGKTSWNEVNAHSTPQACRLYHITQKIALIVTWGHLLGFPL